MIKVAAILKEGAEYLANRLEPLTVTLDAGNRSSDMPQATAQTRDKRKIIIGTVPDFSWQGEGVRVDDILPNSPAQQAQLQQGDILIRLAGQPVTDLKSYADILRVLKAGEKIELQLRREKDIKTIEIVPVER